MKLFVYGTLMTGQSNHYLLRDYISDVIPLKLSGYLMYSAGDYPVIAEGTPADIIHGELVTLRDGNCIGKILYVLDLLEDYCEERAAEDNLYLRKKITIPGHGSGIWIYVWNRTTDSLVIVSDGDWRRLEKPAVR